MEARLAARWTTLATDRFPPPSERRSNLPNQAPKHPASQQFDDRTPSPGRIIVMGTSSAANLGILKLHTNRETRGRSPSTVERLPDAPSGQRHSAQRGAGKWKPL
jgi:hypothetical protein